MSAPDSRTILVTPRSLTRGGHPELERLRDAGFELRFAMPGVQPDESELCELVRGCVGYLAGVEPVSARVFEAAPGLRAISRNGIGIDSIDAAAAARHCVKILTAPGANARGVAELTLALLFAAARGVVRSDREIRAGGWHRDRGIELAGRTLGVIGYGNVGRRVALLAAAIGMRPIVYDPIAELAGAEPRPEWASLHALLGASDAITLHLPAQERPLVERGFLGEARSGVIIVNTARAALVDEEALLDALDTGRVRAYATDVHDPEPPANRRLVEHPSVISTAHVGGYTDESVERATEAAVTNLINELCGG